MQTKRIVGRVLFFLLVCYGGGVSLRDRSYHSMTVVLITKLGVSNKGHAFLLVVVPPVLAALLAPLVSYHSDRLRTRWGRRIPIMLVAMTFLSMSVAEAHGAFHRVELIQARLGEKIRMISQIVFDMLSLGASAVVTWQLTRLTLNSWRAEDVAPTPLQTPLWLPQSAMAIGMALLCFALIRTIIVKARRMPRSARS